MAEMMESPATHLASKVWKQFLRSARWYPFLLANVVVFAIWNLVPWVSMIEVSFSKWDMLTPREWVGIDNFAGMAQDGLLRIALCNTFLYALMYVPTVMLVSFLVALFVNRPVPGMKAFRALYFLPNVTSVVVLSIVYWRLLAPRADSPLNYLLGLVGIAPQRYFLSTSQALPSVAGVAVWSSFGYLMVLWLAGLQGIPQELYDAALVDGASGLKLHLHVTLPMLRPTAAFILITSTIGALQIFESIFVLTGGGPVNATLTVVYHIYRQAFIFGRLGYASAVSILFFAIILAIALIQGKHLRFGEGIY